MLKWRPHSRIGAGHPDRLSGDDAVHLDFHPGNLPAAGGSITGVVDWDGAARGDHRFDLATPHFGIHGGGADPAPNSAWTDGDRHPPRRTTGPPLTSPSTAGG
ncbi:MULTISPECIES: phosphotransferase [Streptomyces]|uniref:phosphotransferase n=1 Tax=Streptomyces TaxID=1883 RepID=UPI00211D24CF|nr:phosphotransferase [Streptomyces sp. st115]